MLNHMNGELWNTEDPKEVALYHKEICDFLHNLYIKKNAAYGDSFHALYKQLGIISGVTQVAHKYNRLINLVKNPNIDNLGEDLSDTLMDLANYSILVAMEINREKIQKQIRGNENESSN